MTINNSFWGLFPPNILDFGVLLEEMLLFGASINITKNFFLRLWFIDNL